MLNELLCERILYRLGKSCRCTRRTGMTSQINNDTEKSLYHKNNNKNFTIKSECHVLTLKRKTHRCVWIRFEMNIYRSLKWWKYAHTRNTWITNTVGRYHDLSRAFAKKANAFASDPFTYKKQQQHAWKTILFDWYYYFILIMSSTRVKRKKRVQAVGATRAIAHNKIFCKHFWLNCFILFLLVTFFYYFEVFTLFRIITHTFQHQYYIILGKCISIKQLPLFYIFLTCGMIFIKYD